MCIRDRCTQTDDGLIQVQHLTFNPFIVEALLKKQENLYVQISECHEEDTARPSPSMVCRHYTFLLKVFLSESLRIYKNSYF